MRRYGLLLHISSLPSAWGIGDLGPAAHSFARTAAQAGASVWQFLPLNPTSTFIGNSPYSSLSAFAGNPLFISPEFLVRDGYISHADLDSSLLCVPNGSFTATPSLVDFNSVTVHREHILHAAFERNRYLLQSDMEFQSFCRYHHYWLHDYARFVTLKAAHGGAGWQDWPRILQKRDPQALADWDLKAAQDIFREKFIQYLFFSQWKSLRRTCQEERLALLADVPIYVTHDSVDVWANPHYFNLDENLHPITVSGVPPDYFSATGQRWGTPVYKWDKLEQDGFAWWKQRLGHTLLLADMVRLDHFRGFCGYWEIPAAEETAVNGTWKTAPGKALFSALREHFGSLPFLAEDLGVITEDVYELMDDCHLPGMHVLQFAFGGPDPASNPDIPHAHTPNSFVYTGTHDNPPTRNWFAGASREELGNLSAYTGSGISEENVTAVLVRLAFSSVAGCAILPVQDVLNLGAKARMNTPGIARGNWVWRLAGDDFSEERLAWIRELAKIYGRLSASASPSVPPAPGKE